MTREAMLAGCDGIDVMRVLAAALQFFRPRGLQAVRTLDADGLMRLAFDFAEFESDRAFWKMRKWERQNPKYPLLRLWRLLDPLQVVLDQRYWEADLKSMMASYSEAEGLILFKMDLDNFKEVNDALGHAGGDEAIRVYCRTVQAILGTVAEVYRRGGDEVVAFAPGLRKPRASALAEAVRSEIERTFLRWGAEHRLRRCPTASIGVVEVDAKSTYSGVVRLLDETQLRAKREGKNRVVLA
jgi:diguanylate cyclase (GGDEF)-like protein